MIRKYHGAQLYFGNKETLIKKSDIKQQIFTQQLQVMMQQMKSEQLVVLHQTHSNKGYVIDDTLLKNSVSLYEYEGDYLLTSLKRCALVVLTADCVPLILYDKHNEISGIVHAGWKGAAAGVVIKALEDMTENMHARKEDIEIFFGASAQPCCYEVSQDFKQHFDRYFFASKVFIHKQKKLFFDNHLFIQLQLKEFGILAKNIYNEYVSCSICDEQYCSFRREKEKAGRQITAITLQ